MRGLGSGSTLYANSTGAGLDIGKLKWYFSHSPGETFDLDEVFERILIDHGPQKTLMTTGKAGILWKLDRVTGKYLDSRETVFQNVFNKIDPKTGAFTYRAMLSTRAFRNGCHPARDRRAARTGRRRAITSPAIPSSSRWIRAAC